jgi:hypothetical protein
MSEAELNSSLNFAMIRPQRMGFNFTVRPTSEYAVNRAPPKKFESQVKLDKHLLKIRRMRKRL